MEVQYGKRLRQTIGYISYFDTSDNLIKYSKTGFSTKLITKKAQEFSYLAFLLLHASFMTRSIFHLLSLRPYREKRD